MMKLRELAHSRTGDKGDTSNISVICYKPEDYDYVRQVLSPECVKAYFQGLFATQGQCPDLNVQRYELPALHALNFVIAGVLQGGVTRSLAIDAHGKSLGSILLAMDVSPTAR